jgi:hypothetical protein
MKRYFAFLTMLVVACGSAAAAETGHRTFMVRLYADPGFQRVVEIFRPKGYHVDVIAEGVPTKTVADYPVIEVGSEVPAGEAIQVIRAAREVVPTLRYVFITEDPDMANVIFVGAGTSWIKYKDLKPLSEKDFQDLCAGEPSMISFHAKVRRFGL